MTHMFKNMLEMCVCVIKHANFGPFLFTFFDIDILISLKLQSHALAFLLKPFNYLTKHFFTKVAINNEYVI